MSNGIEEVISALYEMVQDAWSLPLGADKCVLERDKVLDLLDEINNQLPTEFKQAKTIVDARNEIITNAKREAESILKQAEQKARQLTTEESIYRQAQAEAARLLADTKAQADELVRARQERLQELKNATMSFVLDSLREAEQTISGSLRDVETAKQRFEQLSAPKSAPAPEPAPEPEQPAEAAQEPETEA